MDAERRRRRRVEINALKLSMGGCVDCGYNAHPAALDFAHVDATTKLKPGGDAIRPSWSWQRIVDEIAKCIILCANCHRIRTANDGLYTIRRDAPPMPPVARVRSGPAPHPVVHGTRHGYSRGCRCAECRRACADYAREYYRRKKAGQ